MRGTRGFFPIPLPSPFVVIRPDLPAVSRAGDSDREEDGDPGFESDSDAARKDLEGIAEERSKSSVMVTVAS